MVILRRNRRSAGRKPKKKLFLKTFSKTRRIYMPKKKKENGEYIVADLETREVHTFADLTEVKGFFEEIFEEAMDTGCSIEEATSLLEYLVVIKGKQIETAISTYLMNVVFNEGK
jgi:hypothetical protein